MRRVGERTPESKSASKSKSKAGSGSKAGSPAGSPVSRRRLLGGGAAVAAGIAGAAFGTGTGHAAAPSASPARAAGGCANKPLAPVPVPEQMAAGTGLADVSGARLWYWDTGGSGTPVVFLHPASGSGLSWPYQQPVFAKAGHRAVGYSRRGSLNADPGTATANGTASGDLHTLLDQLGIERFHAVAVAAGGSVAFDYALSHPERILSLTVANSLGGVTDADYLALVGGLRPRGFNALPAEFRELGPSYRATNPAGVTTWVDHAAKVAAGTSYGQGNANQISWATLARLAVPTLLVTGDADLWLPPAVLRLFAEHLPHAETAVIPECGHAPHWERPDVFNPTVLQFIARHDHRG